MENIIINHPSIIISQLKGLILGFGVSNHFPYINSLVALLLAYYNEDN